MSEHEDLIQKLDRIETKLDLLAQAMNIEYVLKCEDPYHRDHRWSHSGPKCPKCKGYLEQPYFKRTLTVE